MKKTQWLAGILVLGFLLGCSKEEAVVEEGGEPDHLAVQHLLVAFKGSIGKASVTRSKEEAKTLAYALFERAKGGEDFDALVKEFTDDSHPGVYRMSNTGVSPDKSTGEFARNELVGAFGDVGFALKKNDIGIADFDPDSSPFGWHIIKRVE